ncbi:MAG: hypothetical protein RR244_04875 [Oscillospiraceae bacterium]
MFTKKRSPHKAHRILEKATATRILMEFLTLPRQNLALYEVLLVFYSYCAISPPQIQLMMHAVFSTEGIANLPYACYYENPPCTIYLIFY